MRPVGARLGGPAGGRSLVAVRGGPGGYYADAGSLDEGTGHAHGGCPRTHVDDPGGARVSGGANLRGPVNGGSQNGSCQAVSEFSVDAALRCPLVNLGEGVGQHGGVEGHVDRKVLAHRTQRATAALVRVVRRLVFSGRALNGGNQRRQVVRGARDDVCVRIVTQRDRQRMGR